MLWSAALTGLVLVGVVHTSQAARPAGAPGDQRAAAPLPRLRAVPPQDGQRGYLVAADSGKRYTPRGSNYVRLTEVSGDGRTIGYHSTFQPGRYTGQEAERVLAAMARDGYDAVRVFLDHGDPNNVGGKHGLGHGKGDTSAGDPAYLDNVVDFTRRAAAHRIRVMYSMDAFPQNDHYYDIVREHGYVPNINGDNLWYMHTGYVNAKAEYVRMFASLMKKKLGKDIGAVLSYELNNEAYVEGNYAPFHRMSGTVTPVTGLTYDMSEPDQRQQAQDASMVEYANRMVDAVHSVDSEALVSIGAFTYRAVGKPGPQGLPTYCEKDCPKNVDYRYPVRLSTMSRYSRLSFLDIHVYPSPKMGESTFDLDKDLASLEWGQIDRATVLGEYGAMKKTFDNDVTKAAYGMRDLQIATCARGMTGWFFWTYDTTETEVQRLFFNLLETKGAVNGQLAPVARPNPCA